MAVVINKEKLNNEISKNIKQEKKSNQQKPAKKHDGTYTYRPFALFFGKNTEDDTEETPVDEK